MCKIWCNVGAGRCYNVSTLLILASCDYWLLAHVKELLWGKRFEAGDGINAAVTASLHCPSKDNYTAATDHLPCRWEKCVGSAIDYIE